jgi:hypothetical protein
MRYMFLAVEDRKTSADNDRLFAGSQHLGQGIGFYQLIA